MHYICKAVFRIAYKIKLVSTGLQDSSLQLLKIKSFVSLDLFSKKNIGLPCKVQNVLQHEHEQGKNSPVD